MCTDLSIEPLKVIELYGYRFKIEVGFKQALRTLGAGDREKTGAGAKKHGTLVQALPDSDRRSLAIVTG